MVNMLINSMTQIFDIITYHDKCQKKLRDAIMPKINDNEIMTADIGRPTIIGQIGVFSNLPNQ